MYVGVDFTVMQNVKQMYVGCVVIKSRTSETRPLCTIRVKTAVILIAKNMCYYLLPEKIVLV